MGLHCPKCGSSRVRRGYEIPPLPLRLVGIHGLLCDGCNLSYRGFAIPGTVPLHPQRKSRSYRKDPEAVESKQVSEPLEDKERTPHAWSHEEGGPALSVIPFLWYYAKLRVRVLFGLYQTNNSLGIRYRWRNWQHWQRDKH